ncbi:phosphotriesterase family protein [Microbacterium sp. XT11]|uniref:phosphotriesterase family protein n=1 Tax=Microbacterium sp. XT11 TaxID=367477 RepID=UPI000742F22F|nr:aryldialkylphosphatase [Microbacterium sp. XT11]ALX65762.1 putative metal-dependent hydrolase with the TIM-barrel fold [Microbacterium sp. XT11]
MNGFVRTATGDVSPGDLGRTDYHEHLFQVSPLLPGDDLDDETASAAEAGHLRRSGFDTMVDATPLGLGRRPSAIARISRETGLIVVLTTGVHRREHYAADDPLLAASESELAAAFTADLLDGAVEEDSSRAPQIRAGVLKVGLGYWRIDELAGRAISAIGEAHRITGAPVMVHLEFGTAAFEVLDRLADAGVAASSTVLAHMDRNPDPGLHAELAATGAYLGYDGPARHREWPDSTLLDCLVRTAGSGGGDRILLGGDVARRSRYRAYGGIPGLAYLGERFVPRLRAIGGDDLVDAVLRANPARWLTWRPAG